MEHRKWSPLQRERVLDAIRRNPGATTREIASSLDLHYSTVLYHVRRLAGERATVLESRPWGILHYPVGEVACPWLRQALPLLRDPLVEREIAAALGPEERAPVARRTGRSVKSVRRLLSRRGIVEGPEENGRVPREHASCAASALRGEEAKSSVKCAHGNSEAFGRPDRRL